MRMMGALISVLFLSVCAPIFKRNNFSIPYSRYNVLQCKITNDSASGDTLRIDLLVQEENPSTLESPANYKIIFSDNPFDAQEFLVEAPSDTLFGNLFKGFAWFRLQGLSVRDITDSETKERRKKPLFNFNYGKIHILHVWDKFCKVENTN